MPPRVARANVSSSKPQNGRKKSQKRNLDAFSIASHSVPQTQRVSRHRLGEIVNDGPRQKRRRVQDDDEDDEEENASAARRSKRGGLGDDELDEGSDSEGNEWRMGGPIGDDSDSSLDSDEAFGESDEERFESFTFRGSSKKKAGAKQKKKTKVSARAQQEMDLDEASDADEDEEEDSDFGDEGVDLATMLDGSDDEDEDAKPKASKRSRHEQSEDDEEGDDDDEDDDEDEEDSEDSGSEPDSDDATADPTKLSKLQDLIASLDDNLPEKKITARDANAHESQQPSAFGLTSSQKLKISDLLPTVTDPALRKSLKLLSSDKTSKSSKASGVPGKLTAPLPKRQQDKLDRAAATQQAKETLDRWRDTVVHNRRAEFLQFPLKDPNASAPLGTNKMLAVQQEKPHNDLESAIQDILVESGLGSERKPGDEEDKLQQFEELQLNKIPIEEVMARRAALRRARELLFREEVKAKRIKKIKSKAYRRVHRKERERDAAKEQAELEAQGIDMSDDDKDRMDRRRAEERMGAKHRESKWAKGMKKSGRTVWDDDARDGIVDMARRNEELRKRIEGKDVRERDSGDSDLSEDEDDEEDFDSDDEAAEKNRLTKQLNKLDAKDGENSKLGSMLFMQRAEAARKAQNDEDMERMRRELGDEKSASEEDEAETTVSRRVFGPKGKQAAAPKPKEVRPELEERPSSDDEDQDAEIIVDRPASNDKVPVARRARSFLKSSQTVMPEDPKASVAADPNGWLDMSSKESKRSKKHQTDDDTVIAPMVAPQPAKVEAQQPKKASKSKAAKSQKSESAPAAAAAAAPATNGWTVIPQPLAPNDASDDSSDELSDPMLSQKEQRGMLHERAFAGDDTAAAFEAEKAEQMEDEDDKVVSTHLPGWGSWAGDGLSKATRKQNKRIAHNPLRKQVIEGVKAGNRKDAKLKNVVISEAQQRKGKKYLASQLPHEFERTDQYERSLRIPVGPEWTTKETFQRNTRPRVVVKQGIIAPMEKPLF